MAKNIFVNLPVKDVARAKEFVTNLGFTVNPDFSDESGICVVMGENIYAMLLHTDKFKGFTKKEIPNTVIDSELILTFGVDSKEEVDQIVEKAIEAGGKDSRKEDYGWMYGRAFEDLDGHIWEAFWMDPNAKPGQENG